MIRPNCIWMPPATKAWSESARSDLGTGKSPQRRVDVGRDVGSTSAPRCPHSWEIKSRSASSQSVQVPFASYPAITNSRSHTDMPPYAQTSAAQKTKGYCIGGIHSNTTPNRPAGSSRTSKTSGTIKSGTCTSAAYVLLDPRVNAGLRPDISQLMRKRLAMSMPVNNATWMPGKYHLRAAILHKPRNP